MFIISDYSELEKEYCNQNLGEKQNLLLNPDVTPENVEKLLASVR